MIFYIIEMGEDMTYQLSDGLPWSLEALLITILLLGNFFPFYIALAVFAVVFIILGMTNCFKPSFINLQAEQVMTWIFIFYTMSISTIFQNWIGLLISFGFLFAFLIFAYYERAIRPYFFEDLMNICLLASMILFIFALLENFKFIPEWDYTFISKAMSKTHPNRVEATFFNPNYYAMMLEFFFLIGIYKLNHSKKIRKKITYGLISACNLLAIIYTGNRTSYGVLIFSILVYFYVLGYKKQAVLSFITMLVGLLLLIPTDILPRMDDLNFAIGDRWYIWQGTLSMLKDNLWFGQGPMTYLHIRLQYPEAKGTVYHAHNLFLNMWLDFGLVGLSIMAYPLLGYIKLLNRMRYFPRLRPRLALVMSFWATVLIHGLTDVTIMWIQTLFLFAVVILPIRNMVSEYEQEKSSKVHHPFYSQ